MNKIKETLAHEGYGSVASIFIIVLIIIGVIYWILELVQSNIELNTMNNALIEVSAYNSDIANKAYELSKANAEKLEGNKKVQKGRQYGKVKIIIP